MTEAARRTSRYAERVAALRAGEMDMAESRKIRTALIGCHETPPNHCPRDLIREFLNPKSTKVKDPQRAPTSPSAQPKRVSECHLQHLFSHLARRARTKRLAGRTADVRQTLLIGLGASARDRRDRVSINRRGTENVIRPPSATQVQLQPHRSPPAALFLPATSCPSLRTH